MADTFAADLARLSPTASPVIIDGFVANARLLDQAGINTPIRLRHFLARVCVETGGLRSLEEDLKLHRPAADTGPAEQHAFEGTFFKHCSSQIRNRAPSH